MNDMENTAMVVKALIRDLGNAKNAIRYIDEKLTAEGRGYYAEARAELVKVTVA